jgi:hypothetical protein
MDPKLLTGFSATFVCAAKNLSNEILEMLYDEVSKVYRQD